MRILGIDPGLQLCGYAVVETDRITERLLEAGTFRTDNNQPLENRLNSLCRDSQSLLENFRPDIIAVEQLYSHYAHPKTAILMGHARGVILQKAAETGISVRSFSPTRIKKSITGNGRASKQQVQRAIQSLLALKDLPEPDDVADAIAVALCCANDLNVIVSNRKSRNKNTND
jgi:crossover junction endodeoxyribonuclease RuvC